MHISLCSYLKILSFVILVAFAAAFPNKPVSADQEEQFLGHWVTPSFEQKKSRISEQCKLHADSEVATIPEAKVQVFRCNDPNHADHRQRIEKYIAGLNKIYDAQERPLYDENISGLCVVVSSNNSQHNSDICNPSPELRTEPIIELPIIWNIRETDSEDWPFRGDSYSPSSGYGAISCFKLPSESALVTKGCRRWGIEYFGVGGKPCDCDCSIVCQEFTWGR